MSTLFLGILMGIAGMASDNAAKEIMKKIHANDPEKLQKLKFPGYSSYAYFEYRRQMRKNENTTN